jgi:ribosomal protein S4
MDTSDRKKKALYNKKHNIYIQKKYKIFMLKKPYNKIRYPFLKASFSENLLPFKKLNRKGVKLNILSNKRGLTNTIRKIQKNIIEQERRDIIDKKSTLKKQNFVTVDNVKKIHDFIKPSLHLFHPFSSKKVEKSGKQTKLGLAKNNNIDQNGLPSCPYFTRSKYMFSLEQLKAEFHKKQSQHRKSSHFKTLLEERKKLSIIYGCLGEKKIKKLALQANKFSGKFDENFIKIIESRLDVVLFRICFFPTIFSARQWINHKHILVNNSIVYSAGYQLKSGDIISVLPEKRLFLKRKISSFMAEKMKIRSIHYRLKMDTFYTVIKNYMPYVNVFEKKEIQKEGYTSSLQNQRKITRKDFKESYNKIFKERQGRNRNKILKSIDLLPKILYTCPNFSERKQNFLSFLKVRNLFTLVRPLRQRVAGLRISGMKPLNLEVCYKNMVAIFLYSPQKVALPASLDLHSIAKNFIL